MSGRLRIRALWENLTSTLWFVPAVMTAAAVGLALAMVAFDRRSGDHDDPWFFLYSGGAEGAREVLSTIAGSMITVAGVVFSATVVALSFASSQLGPRLLRSFMRDRGNQVVLGTFIATFVYCLLVLRTVSDANEFVPHFGVTAGLVLALVSLGVLIFFIHHVALSLQADYVLSIVGRELDASVERLYPGGGGEEAPELRHEELSARERELREEKSIQVSLHASGYLHSVDLDSLIELATEHDLIIRIGAKPGRYVYDGVPVADLWPASHASQEVAGEVSSAFVVGRTRTSQQDVEFAVNQLVEVAVRALSTGINDPFTTVSCIDRIGTGLLHLMRRSIPGRYRLDRTGRLRLIAERPDFAGVADAAFNQIRQAAASTPAVTIHLLDTLNLLLEHAATDEQRHALERHRILVRRDALEATGDPADRNELRDRAERRGL